MMIVHRDYTPTVQKTPAGTLYLREPGVAVLSVPHVDINRICGFLDGFAPELQFNKYSLELPTRILIPESTILCKVAGQTCYLSFGPGSTPHSESEKYIRNILESQHGCYDIETDVLTSEGWRSWLQVDESTLFATRTDDGRIEYHRPINLIAYNYKGPMYKVDSAGVDLLVTPDHKMLACSTTTRLGRSHAGRYSLITCKELQHRSHKYTKTAKWESANQSGIKRAEAALLGFTIGDGYVSDNGCTARFRLRRARKIAWLVEECARAGIVLRSNSNDTYAFTSPRHLRSAFYSIYDENGDKQIPQTVLLSADRDVSQGILDGLVASDGCTTPTGRLYDTTSKHLAGQIQQLCLHVGCAANISQAACYADRTHGSFGKKAIYRVHILQRAPHPEVNKYAGCVGRSEWIENWNGMVYCAEVPNNTLYVRRNGKPVWSGNSVLEHANFTLLLWGISRSMTHEIVRHRAGFSYSQVSQRYVDGSKLRFVERPEYAGDVELHALFEQRIDRAATEYNALAERLLLRQQAGIELFSGEKKSDLRKKVNQAARSILPNETEAPIVITANARAWRHFIEMRASAFAEVEIRRLAFQVYTVLFNVDPYLFMGYTPIKLDDGTDALESKYRKV